EKNRSANASRSNRRSRAQYGYQNPKLADGLGIALVLLVGTGVAAVDGHDQAARRNGRRHLCHGFLEALSTVLAPQRWAYHQSGIRPSRSDTSRSPLRSI